MEAISIIVISHNEEKNIKDCLDSLVQLDYATYEIVVVDCSSDNTPDIVKNYKTVRLIKCNQPGFGIQRNVGISHARYGFIAFTDADCIVPGNWLKILAGNIKKDIAVVGGNAYSPPGTSYFGKCFACLGYPAGGDLGLDAVTKVSKEGHVQHIATCNAIFRSEVLIKTNGFNEKLVWGGEDADICERITNAGWKIKYAGDSFVYHKARCSLKSFVQWIYRRGNARYHYSKNRLKLYLSLALGITGILFLAIKPWITFIMGLIVLTGTITAILFTSKFKYLIRRRKRIKVSLTSIILVIAPLELLRHVIMLAGETKEALKNAIGKMTKRLKRGQKSDRSPG